MDGTWCLQALAETTYVYTYYVANNNIYTYSCTSVAVIALYEGMLGESTPFQDHVARDVLYT